jgi:hypothetical protein
MVYKRDVATHHRNWERTYNISIDTVSARTLRAYMHQEINYYNTLINEFNSKLRVLYNEIGDIKDQNERIWLIVAQTGIDLRTLISKPIDTWPEALKPYAESIVKNNKLLLSERMMLLFDIAASKSLIHPIMRKLLAAEVLHWVQPQAYLIAESNSHPTGQLRCPLQMLQTKDYAFKRHVQLIDSIIDIIYDQSRKSTFIKIPYLTVPIQIEGYDLTRMPHNNIIIRQCQGKLPDENTPWQLTVREGIGNYLIDITDMYYVQFNKKNKK